MLEKIEDEEGKFVYQFLKHLNNQDCTNQVIKMKILNKMLIHYNINMKGKKVLTGECPFVQPSTQNVTNRILLSYLKDEFSLDYSLNTDFSFDGGLKPFLGRLYMFRDKCFGKVGSCFSSSIF